MTQTITDVFSLGSTAKFHFTKFEVLRCILLQGEQGEYFLPIDGRQDEAVLGLIAGQDCLHDGSLKLHLIVNEIEKEQYAMIVRESDELFGIAVSSIDSNCAMPSAEFSGVRWQVQGFASDKPDLPFTMTSGNDEAGVRNICAAMQSMVDTRDRLRNYNDKLNTAGRAPDGNDYNAVLDIFGL